MMGESKGLNNIELDILYSQALLNSKLLALIENQRSTEAIKIFKLSNEDLAILDLQKDSLFFSATTHPQSALEIFVHVKANYSVNLIEGSDQLIHVIGDYLSSRAEKYSNTSMFVLSREVSEYLPSISSDFEFLRGKELYDFGAHELVRKFSSERLNTMIDEAGAKQLLLSSTREFVGLKVNDEAVSIAAWIREVRGYRCLSYVFTQEKYRGRGFSQLVLAKLLSDIGDNYNAAFLFVETSNIPALGLYSKCGFKKRGSLSQIKLANCK